MCLDLHTLLDGHFATAQPRLHLGKAMRVCHCLQMEYIRPLTVSILSERRALRPYGLLGGHAALPGLNLLIKPDGRTVNLGAKNSTQVEAGDRVRIYTPGALQLRSTILMLLLNSIQHINSYGSADMCKQQYDAHVRVVQKYHSWHMSQRCKLATCSSTCCLA